MIGLITDGYGHFSPIIAYFVPKRPKLYFKNDDNIMKAWRGTVKNVVLHNQRCSFLCINYTRKEM